MQAGPAGEEEQVRFTLPLKGAPLAEATDNTEIGEKVAIVPADTVSLRPPDIGARQKSPVAVPVKLTVCVGVTPLSWMVSVACRTAGSAVQSGVKVTWIEQLVVMGEVPQLSVSVKSWPAEMVEPHGTIETQLIFRGCPGPALVSVTV